MGKHMDIEALFFTVLIDMNKMGIKREVEGGETLMMKSDNTIIRCERFVPDPMVYEGKWKLTKASVDGVEVTFPEDTDIVIGFATTKESPTYRWYAKVLNNFQAEVDVVRDFDDGLDAIKVGKVRSTEMGPPAELQDIELFFRVTFEGMDRMKINTDGKRTLIMTGGGAELYAESVQRRV